MGGISTQKTLLFGYQRESGPALRSSIKEVAIIAASHEITSDCPLENLRALLEAIQEVNQSTIPLLGKIAT